MKIKDIKAYEILSSGSSPTIEVKITLNNNIQGKASVPYGASAGIHEAITLMDTKAKRYHGKGMKKAIQNIEKHIKPLLIGLDVEKQQEIDRLMIQKDGTEQKTKLGGNAILAVSLACARAAAISKKIPTWIYLQKTFKLPEPKKLPEPMVVVVEGGVHADNSTDFQEYLLVPSKQTGKPTRSIQKIIETYQILKKVLQKKKYNTNVGNEGAYAPSGMKNNEEPLKLLVEAIKKAGYKPGKDISIALDPATSEVYASGKYNLKTEKKKKTSQEMIQLFKNWSKKYPIISLEDGLAEDDWDFWPILNKELGKKMLIVGDDLTTTSPKRVQKAVETESINSVLIKPNQIGTLTETMETIAICQNNSFETVVSHRGGGETNDTMIIDIAVAAGSKFVKVGPARGERVEKYNRLMEIEREEWKQI